MAEWHSAKGRNHLSRFSKWDTVRILSTLILTCKNSWPANDAKQCIEQYSVLTAASVNRPAILHLSTAFLQQQQQQQQRQRQPVLLAQTLHSDWSTLTMHSIHSAVVRYNETATLYYNINFTNYDKVPDVQQ